MAQSLGGFKAGQAKVSAAGMSRGGGAKKLTTIGVMNGPANNRGGSTPASRSLRWKRGF